MAPPGLKGGSGGGAADARARMAERQRLVAELERARTAIVIKTRNALLSKYKHMSPQEEATLTKSAKAFARGLYWNLRSEAEPERVWISREDIEPLFDKAEQAEAAFKMLDTANDGQVTKRGIREVVLKIYAERRNIAASLADTDSIVQTLEIGIGVLVHFIFFAIYLFVFGVDILQGFSTFSATVSEIAQPSPPPLYPLRRLTERPRLLCEKLTLDQTRHPQPAFSPQPVFYHKLEGTLKFLCLFITTRTGAGAHLCVWQQRAQCV